jgi:hypothetical protein
MKVIAMKMIKKLWNSVNVTNSVIIIIPFLI